MDFLVYIYVLNLSFILEGIYPHSYPQAVDNYLPHDFVAIFVLDYPQIIAF